MTKQYVCPECSGPWLYSFTFQHDPASCSLSKADDATRAADRDTPGRFVSDRSIIFSSPLLGDGQRVRPATPTELILRAVFIDPAEEPAAQTPVTRVLSTGLDKRIVNDFDPDTITTTNS